MGWRRVVRRVVAWSTGPPLVLIAALAGTSLALLYTPPGKALSSRAIAGYLTGKIAGDITIGGFRGGLIRHVVVENVTVADSNGVVLLDAPRIEARYFLLELLAGRIVVRELNLSHPTIHLARLRSNRWNYEAVFRKSDDAGEGDPSRIEFRDVSIESGNLRVDAPTDPAAARQPISRNGAEPGQRETQETNDGLVRVYRARQLSGRFSMIRLSTPDRDPIRIVVDSLSTMLTDPNLQITDLAGEFTTAGDSLNFQFEHANLPASRLVGEGLVRWPNGPIQFDFKLTADTVALADLRWIQPDFPDWSGHGMVTAFSRNDRHTEYRLEDLVLGNSIERAAGRMVAITDADQGFGVADVDLALRNVSLEVMHPYLDTLPFAGTLTGDLVMRGYAASLDLEGHLDFFDALPQGKPRSLLDFSGNVSLGGAQGAVFRGLALRSTMLNLATVTQLIPSVELPGTLRLVGRLDGPWKQVVFRGTAEHMATNNALSRMTGTVGFDTRDSLLNLSMNADFDRLSFDGLRTGYPKLTPRGGLVGHVEANGRLDSLQIDANVTGEIGEVAAVGRIGLSAPHYEFDSLAMNVRRFDAQAFLGTGSNTAISGKIVAQGAIDSGVPPVGMVSLDLVQSRVGGVTVGGLNGVLRSDGRLIGVDSVVAQWPDGHLVAHGDIGWTSDDSGAVAIGATVASLAPLDSLVRNALPLEPDTLGPNKFGGAAEASLTVSGSIVDPAINGTVTAVDVVLDRWYLGTLSATIGADTLSTNELSVDGRVDSLRFGDRVATDLALLIERGKDSTNFDVSGKVRDAFLGVAGWQLSTDSGSTIGITELSMILPRQQWHLQEAAQAKLIGKRIELGSPVVLNSLDGSGAITLRGTVPGDQPGELDLSVRGFDLGDFYSMLDSNTTALGGIASVDFHLAGTRTAPRLNGNAMVTGPTFRGSNPPLVKADFDYADLRLKSNVTFWKTGSQVLGLDLSLPFDLALASRETRRLPGEIEITAVADSVELSVLEAFTSSIDTTRGAMDLDLSVTGTWDAPRFNGELAIIEGRTSLPSLGVRYSPINGHATFYGDSMVVDTLLISSGEADMTASGLVRFEKLSRPVLDLTLRSEGFLAINDPGFMVLRPTGTVTITGPLSNPVMSGQVIRVDDSELFFADLLNKNVLDLEDPKFADLVDVKAIREQRLGADLQNRFLDSLRIDNLRFRVGNNVWLRSSEADIQLEGEVQVQKVRKNYRLTGTLNTPRGRYTLRLGPLYREFEVESGSVRYSGTPDLNADLDLTAKHNARTTSGEELPIVARITGSILVPKIQLSTPGQQLTERDLISYMVLGQPESQVGSAFTGSFAVQTALGAISGELQRVLLQERSLAGLDVLELRPVIGTNSESGTFTRLAAGWQLGDRWFVTLNAGFCLGGEDAQQLSAQNFGASVEYRFARDWRAQASAEPVQSCLGGRLGDAFSTISRRYQLGADLLWEREY